MPLFDFICTDCGHNFERITKASIANVECPQCGAGAHKQVSAPAKPVFKGTGFYETDFKSK